MAEAPSSPALFPKWGEGSKNRELVDQRECWRSSGSVNEGTYERRNALAPYASIGLEASVFGAEWPREEHPLPNGLFGGEMCHDRWRLPEQERYRAQDRTRESLSLKP
jgi:hypothetical protein